MGFSLERVVVGGDWLGVYSRVTMHGSAIGALELSNDFLLLHTIGVRLIDDVYRAPESLKRGFGSVSCPDEHFPAYVC